MYKEGEEPNIGEFDEEGKGSQEVKDRESKNTPLWMRKSEDVTHEVSLCKSLSNDWKEHFVVKHFCVEGQFEI